MAWLIPQSKTELAAIALSLGAGDDVFVAEDVTLASQSDSAIFGAAGGHTVRIYGSAIGNTDGIFLGTMAAGETGDSIMVAAGGHVEALTDDAIIIGTDGATVENRGLIIAADVGIALSSLNAATQAVITNHGTIQAGQVAIGRFINTAETIVLNNFGTVSGVFAYGMESAGTANARDLITNRGVMNGKITLDAGNDLYDGRGGKVFGQVLGGLGGDTLLGGSEKNVFDGGGGNDLLNGGVGNDALTGGANNDTFLFNAPVTFANRDTITDFVAVNDTMRLENAVFTRLAPGPLHPTMFKLSTQAKDANDYIQYNKTSGALIYDSNGSGAGGAVHFATLSTKPTISHLDFMVI